MAGLETLPDLSRDVLVDLGGWSVLHEARDLVKAGAVKACTWEKPVLSGRLQTGAAEFHPTLNLRSMAFAENRCSCPQGRRGYICAHAVALCVHAQRQRDRGEPLDPSAKPAEKERTATAPTSAEAAPPATPKQPQSLKLAETADTEILLRLLLPPNLETAASRNAVMLKLEAAVGREIIAPENIFRGRTYSMRPAHAQVAALLEEWGGGRLHGLVQLKTQQLADLLHAFRGEPFVYWLKEPGRPIPWQGDKLAGVGEILEAAARAVDGAGATTRVSENREIEVRRRGQPLPQRESAVERFKREVEEKGDPLTRLEVDGSPQFLAVSLPSREDPRYHRVTDLLKTNHFRLEPSNRKWWLRDRHRVLNFLASHWKTLMHDLDAVFTENFLQRTARIRPADIKVQAQPVGDEFELSVSIEAGGLEVAELNRALATGQHYVSHGDRVFLIDADKVKKLHAMQRRLSGSSERPVTPVFKKRIRRSALRDTENILEELDEPLSLPDAWKRTSAALKSVGELQPAPVPQSLDELLRGYQRIGVAWLWHLFSHGLGGVLADEMGLGKTIQAIGLLSCALKRERARVSGPALVVCPASLVGNWEREARKWAPQLTAFVHHRENRLPDAGALAEVDVVITSYSTMVRDEELFSRESFAVVIADEAQHIKNRRTQAARTLRSLKAQARFVLTGTPIENAVDDLRSIFSFILPGYLSRMPDGLGREDKAWFDQRHLQQAAPYILRRNKRDVAPELPEKLEQVVLCDLGTAQRRIYNETRERTEKAIFEMEMAGQSENKVRFAALTQLLRLRQVCTDPRIVAPDTPPADSAKLAAFQEILEEALDGGHRILVFSQFVTVLQLLREHLNAQGLSSCYLDGSTRDRLGEVDRFNNDASIPVFLISLKAGGTGLNLTSADTVVHYDPWWNPAVEAQATDRAHRIGQDKVVTSYKLIAANTVEEKVLEMQASKAQLLRDLLDESAARTANVSLADIRELLKA